MLQQPISRTQVWQWLHNEVVIEDGRTFNMTYTKIFLMMRVEKSSPNLVKRT
jgi:malate synthase